MKHITLNKKFIVINTKKMDNAESLKKYKEINKFFNSDDFEEFNAIYMDMSLFWKFYREENFESAERMLKNIKTFLK